MGVPESLLIEQITTRDIARFIACRNLKARKQKEAEDLQEQRSHMKHLKHAVNAQ